MALLDLDFSRSVAHEAKLHQRRFILVPRRWSGFAYGRSLAWQTVPFIAASASGLPDESGVYAFLVQPSVSAPLNASYLMYVGETESLRNRYRQYLRRERGPRARIKLYDLFKTYESNQHGNFVHFAYATLPLTERRAAEFALIRALWPPLNYKLPAEMRAAMRILES